jgi:hypothetical protein
MKCIANKALHGIGVKLRRVFGVRRFFGIHTLCSAARPPRELGRYIEINK